MEIHNRSASSLSAPSPTFTTYSSSEDLGDVAARVIAELNLDDDFYSSLQLNDADDFPPPMIIQNDAVELKKDDKNDEEYEEEDDDDDESEFEFDVLCRDDDNSSPISADEIFDNGQIRRFPLFNTDLIYAAQNDTVLRDPIPIRLPLRKLLTKERESAAGDDLDGVPEETYCVWDPKKKKEDEMMIGKKSKSTGSSSKRFRIRDLLYNRSSSDGKETFLFLAPANHHQGGGGSGGDQKKKKKGVVDGKKKSYLPYRQDLVGFFANKRPF